MSLLAQADITANTDTLVLALSGAATVNILIANRAASKVNIRLALVPSGTPAPLAQHYIEYDMPLDANQPLERGGIPLNTGDQIFVRTSAPSVSCTVVGLPI